MTDAGAGRVTGASAAELLWEDGLGAGLQMALFDLVGRIAEVPVHRLLGARVRDATPISWWCSRAAWVAARSRSCCTRAAAAWASIRRRGG